MHASKPQKRLENKAKYTQRGLVLEVWKAGGR